MNKFIHRENRTKNKCIQIYQTPPHPQKNRKKRLCNTWTLPLNPKKM